MNQISMKSGMKISRIREDDAVSKGINHLYICNTFESSDLRTFSKEHYDKVLESHVFLKEKIDKKGKVKEGYMVTVNNKVPLVSKTLHLQMQLLNTCF